MHIISAEQYQPEQLETLFLQADYLRTLQSHEQRQELASSFIGRQVCSLFYEPSTRTRTSFEAGAVKLGMGVVSTENAREFSSATKGETLEDTIRVLDEYGFDIIVLRHHETGAANRAASVLDASKTAIINAGDGKGEHPTQALLDVYSIGRHFDRLDNLNIVMGGDLANGRTVRSLAKLMSLYPDNHITFVSTPELKIGDDIKALLIQRGTSFSETTNMHDSFRNADAVYWTRLQKERIGLPEDDPDGVSQIEAAAEIEVQRELNPDTSLNGGFSIDRLALDILPNTAIIHHPLPRNSEIPAYVDKDPRAGYFKQAGNGLWVRMALMSDVLKAQGNQADRQNKGLYAKV